VTAAARVESGAPAGVRRATVVGGSAILIWSTLAILSTKSGPIPPFQLVATSFALASVIGFGVGLALGRPVLRSLRQPKRVWALGVGGLFGYHACYFAALRMVPEAAVEVSLINYLWPLLIVVFSAFLPGERLTRGHILGTVMGLAGTVLIVAGGGGASVAANAVPGYIAAAVAAILWAGYSVLTRRYGDVPTDAVGGFCLATAVLAGICHFALEPTVWPRGWEWAVVLAIGLGPVGSAFYVWDYGVKHGDIQALGALSYATPLLSTLLLIVLGGAAAPWPVWGAAVLIVGGAVLASGGLFKRR
jgi:drug/metabolite transporter (DMT)-like permease